MTDTPATALARKHLPAYFTDEFIRDGRGLDWNQAVTDDGPVAKLSSGEAALLSLLADFEDRPGVCLHLSRIHPLGVTFSGRLRMLDRTIQNDVLAAMPYYWGEAA